MKIIIIFAVIVAFAAAERESRILGGSNVALGEVPFQASLVYWGTTFHFAGGVLLNSRWVVTTAKGVFGRAGNSVNIVLGIIRRDATFTNRQSSEIRIHPSFDFNTRQHDIAVIRSNTAITFTTSISPATISPSFFDIGSTGDVTGWGSTREDMIGEAVILQRKSVTTVACPVSEFMTYNVLHHFCGGATENNTVGVICTIDVGGPLVNGINMLIGIPFFHDPRFCGRSPDGYLRMSFYRSWIMGNIPV